MLRSEGGAHLSHVSVALQQFLKSFRIKVVLVCLELLRLEGGASRCEGTVHVRVRGKWTRVIIYDITETMKLETAASVCRDLNCGSAVSGTVWPGFQKTPLYNVSPACVKKRSVSECAWRTHRATERSLNMDVLCSGRICVSEL